MEELLNLKANQSPSGGGDVIAARLPISDRDPASGRLAVSIPLLQYSLQHDEPTTDALSWLAVGAETQGKAACLLGLNPALSAAVMELHHFLLSSAATSPSGKCLR
jgi:hypothetical protein